MASTDSSSLVPGAYRLRAVSEKDPSSELYATNQGPREQIIVAPKGKQGQEWEILRTEQGGVIIRALGIAAPDSSYLRNDYLSGKALLRERWVFSLTHVEQNNGIVTSGILGPGRPGVYGSNDWLAVRDGKVSQA
ncbi:hypothetical protein OPQ81_007098 [Rhizoctonia solani]|nr:hypothetical protein OPQ81_007098 [Rhizoctonia solani]